VSSIDPTKQCLHKAEISYCNNTNTFCYRVTADDRPNEPLEHSSLSGVWSKIAKRVNTTREQKGMNLLCTNVSGPKLFGLTQKNIQAQLQALKS